MAKKKKNEIDPITHYSDIEKKIIRQIVIYNTINSTTLTPVEHTKKEKKKFLAGFKFNSKKNKQQTNLYHDLCQIKDRPPLPPVLRPHRLLLQPYLMSKE